MNSMTPSHVAGNAAVAFVRRGMRWILAAGLAAAFASTALAQDYLISELMRKADRREYEGGFCARTSWFMERGQNDTVGFYENARVGTSKVFQDSFSGKNDYCAYLRVDDIFYEGPRRCLRAQMWYCEYRLACARRTFKGCWPGSTTDGMLTWQ
jgi:hypothetical protein